MRNPLRGTTGWTQALAIFAALAVISLGLCGLNYGAVLLLNTSANGPSAPANQGAQRLGGILMGTGMLELVGMAVGALGVVICLLGLLIQTAITGTKQKQ
jgi:hypothetical protein